MADESIREYYFEKSNGNLIPLSKLPFMLGDLEIRVEESPDIFLRGVVSGPVSVYLKVIAWKLDLEPLVPDIYVRVLSSQQESVWMRLNKSHSVYEESIRTTKVLVLFLHLIRQNPLRTRDAVWNLIRKSVRDLEIQPCEKDLDDHMELIKQIALHDLNFAKSKYLRRFVWGKPYTPEESPSYDEEEEDEEMLDQFDSICAYCDNNAGNLLHCQGRCMRSFHPTQVSGANFSCESLGYSQERTNELRARGTFLCDNCREHMHQCFACGLLGSSNNSVFRCFSATCGHFYHPGCVSKLLHPYDEEKLQELSDKIGAGGIFTCPLHTCFQCMSAQGEDSQKYEMQFAMCSRCPKAYHRKCLPSDIKFESDEETQTHQRAWEGRLPWNRILIYCMDHEIIPTLATPRRDHLEFPVVTAKRSRMQGSLEI